MDEAGLIKAEESSTMGSSSPSALPVRLTWYGHEFIENAKNDKIWNQTKEAVSKLGDVSFQVWAAVLADTVMRQLGMKV